jgi:tetratricopeptide (TPR) repeat protein
VYAKRVRYTRQAFVALAAFVVLAGFGGASVAAAGDSESARAHFNRGTKLYDLGRYLEAAKEYEATYELKDDPAILFNIGQAYRLGGNLPDAIRAYKSFLRRVPDSPQRPTVETHIRNMQAELDKQRAATPPPATPPAATVAPPTAQATATAPPATASAPSDDRGRTPVYKKWWLWTIVGGVVVAGVVVGVTVAVVTRDSFEPSLGTIGPSALTVSF